MNFWETIRAAVNPRPLSQAKANQLNAEAEEFFEKLITTGKLSVPDNIPLALGADETAVLHGSKAGCRGQQDEVTASVRS